MKYTLIGILLVASILLVWSFRTGTGQDAVMMGVAIISVIFFSSIDSLWNFLYSRKAKPAERLKADGVNVIAVKSPEKK